MFKWDGYYMAWKVYTNGACKIIGIGGVLVGPINSKFIKLYYP